LIFEKVRQHFHLFARLPVPLQFVRMVRSGRLPLVLLALIFSVANLFAANTEEERAFEVAVNKFHSAPWVVEKDFEAFVQKYPNSPRVPQVILYQSEARLISGQAAGAIELLTTNQFRAGALTPQYLFWLGVAQSQNNEANNAIGTFDEVWRKYPDIQQALDAMVREAALLAGLKDWATVVKLLEQPDGPFQKEVHAGHKNETIASGYLLLGEARLAQNDLDAVDKVLRALIAQPLSGDLKWQQEYLACRKQLASGQLEHTRLDADDLLNTSNPTNRAVGFDFKAGVLEQMTNGTDLEQMTNLADAIAAYTNNLAANVPPELQQRAVLKITELDLKQSNGLPDAVQTLSRFLAQFPQAAAADQAMLALGELRLKQALSGADTNLAETNLFAKALDELGMLISKFPNSPLVGKAYLGRGWCFWSREQQAEETNNYTGAITNFELSQEAFSNAAVRLPFSKEQAEARFKWADTQLQLSNYVGAVANYDYVASNYVSLPEAQSQNLIERALYQSMRAALDETNIAAVTNALDKILVSFPNTFLGPSSLLLAGEGLVENGDPAEARKLFTKFEERYPTNSRIPEVQLAIARSFEKQGDWEAAITNYTNWVNAFPSNALIVAAKFNLARANDMAGHQTNALVLYTNLIAGFPMDALSARAQYWVGNFYFCQAQPGDYLEAEKNFQLVFRNTNWAAASATNLTLTNLLPLARLMAGRAAMQRFAYKQAIDYFTNLLSSDCATNLKVEATMGYADAYISQDSTNKVADLREAMGSLATITNQLPGTWQAAQASGRIGDCYLQLGANDPNQFTNAIAAYRAVLDNPAALSDAKGQARFGIGLAMEKQAGQKKGAEQTELLKAAFSQYLDALYQGLHDSGQPSPFWIQKSALAAGQLAETLQEWQSALCIYYQLKTLLPVMAPKCDQKIAKAIENGASLERCIF